MAIHGIDDAASRIIRTIKSPDDVRRGMRVDRAIDNRGEVILEGRDFIPLQSPDGTVWRVRVDNSGNLTTSEAPS